MSLAVEPPLFDWNKDTPLSACLVYALKPDDDQQKRQVPVAANQAPGDNQAPPPTVPTSEQMDAAALEDEVALMAIGPLMVRARAKSDHKVGFARV